MCTPWTATRIVRWRRKGLSSSTVFCCKHHHKHSDRFWIPPFTDAGDQPMSTLRRSASRLFSEPRIYQLNKLQLEKEEEEEDEDEGHYHQEQNHEEEEDEVNSSSTSSHESSEKFSTGDEKLSSSDDCDDEPIPRYSAVTNEKFSTSSDDIDPSMPRYSAENELDSQSPNSPNFADGDYIVFCFKEGGAFDIVKDDQNSSPEADSMDNTIVRLKSVNRKVKQLIYNGDEDNNNDNAIVDKECLTPEDHTLLRVEEDEEEEEEEEEDNGKGYRNGIDLLTTTNDEWQSNTCDGKGNVDEDSDHDDDDDRDTVYFDPESSVDIIKLGRSSSTNGDDHTIGNESQSDSSTSSFAFPLLNTEWTGSPIKMPKLDSMPKLQAMQLRRHRKLGLHCCRF